MYVTEVLVDSRKKSNRSLTTSTSLHTGLLNFQRNLQVSIEYAATLYGRTKLFHRIESDTA